MSFRSCSTIPVRTGRRCCRNSRLQLRQRFASRRRRSPKRPHGRISCRPQLRQRNSRPSPPRHLRGRRRRSARNRADYPRSRTRRSLHPAASAKTCSMQRATCWDRSPRTDPCRRRSSKPCAEIFHASINVAGSRAFHANAKSRTQLVSGLLFVSPLPYGLFGSCTVSILCGRRVRVCFLRFDAFDDCVVILHVENIELDQGPPSFPHSENVIQQQDIYP